jgi:hypothetical protein
MSDEKIIYSRLDDKFQNSCTLSRTRRILPRSPIKTVVERLSIFNLFGQRTVLIDVATELLRDTAQSRAQR